MLPRNERSPLCFCLAYEAVIETTATLVVVQVRRCKWLLIVVFLQDRRQVGETLMVLLGHCVALTPEYRIE